MGTRPPVPPPPPFVIREVTRDIPLDPSNDDVFEAWCRTTDSRTLAEFCTTKLVEFSTLPRAPIFLTGQTTIDAAGPPPDSGMILIR